ncbi:hypothetical protein [Cytobacillus firmus]
MKQRQDITPFKLIASYSTKYPIRQLDEADIWHLTVQDGYLE